MIVCEIGINHLGSELRAKKMVRQILKTKADAITFQIPSPEFIKNLRFKFRELRISFYKSIIKEIHNKNKKVGFAISNELLIEKLNDLGCDFWKILSRDFYDKNILKKIKNTKKKTYISTGFSNFVEIKKLSNNFGKNGYFIHTSLSHNYEDINLKAITLMKKKIHQKKIAFGLHSPDTKILHYSQCYDPESLFFYVKTNEKIKFPDNEHAIRINRVDEIINETNLLKLAMGKGLKRKIILKNKFDTGKIK
tara:strand:- start:18 stop:770 length:753 start_codon:yes stop_codon:yes gene_type:complete